MYMWVDFFVTWTRDFFLLLLLPFFFIIFAKYRFERTILSRGRTFPRTRFERVSRRIVHEAFIRRDTCVTTVWGTARAPGLGGILLSVRVSREDDNAHGIAVASFSAHLIARQDEVEASWYCARIRPETRDVDHSGCAPFFFFVVESITERLTTI